MYKDLRDPGVRCKYLGMKIHGARLVPKSHPLARQRRQGRQSSLKLVASVAVVITLGVTLRQFWGLGKTAHSEYSSADLGSGDRGAASLPLALFARVSRIGVRIPIPTPVPTPTPMPMPMPMPTATRSHTRNEHGFNHPLPLRLANIRGGEYPRDTVPLMPPQYVTSDAFRKCDADLSEAGWALNDGRWQRPHVICDGPVSRITCMIDAPNGIPVRAFKDFPNIGIKKGQADPVVRFCFVHRLQAPTSAPHCAEEGKAESLNCSWTAFCRPTGASGLGVSMPFSDCGSWPWIIDIQITAPLRLLGREEERHSVSRLWTFS